MPASATAITCALVALEAAGKAEIEMALRLGGAVNPTTREEAAPIFCALGAGNLAAVKELHEAGAKLDVRKDGQTPAQYADDLGMGAIARYLRQSERQQR